MFDHSRRPEEGAQGAPALAPSMPSSAAPRPATFPPPAKPAPALAAALFAGQYDDGPTSERDTLRRLFPEGLTPEQQTFRKTYAELEASDGMIDEEEGKRLREMAHALGTDRMPFLQSMALRGFDPGRVQALYATLGQTDSAGPSPRSPAAHLDERGQPLRDPRGLSAEERRLWTETQASRFDDLHSGTPMRKMISDKQMAEYASGVAGRPGAVKSADSVGGFVGLQAETDGLGAPHAAAVAGLDTDYHARPDVNVFETSAANPVVGRFSEPVRSHGVAALDWEATAGHLDNLRVPLGTYASDVLAEEAERRMGHAVTTPDGRRLREYVPELMQPERDPTTQRPEHGASGLPVLKHVQEINRQVTTPANPRADGANPYTGWGMSAPRRARDDAGRPFAVAANQEYVMGARMPLPPGAAVSQIHPQTGARAPIAPVPAPGSPPSISTSDARIQATIHQHLGELGRSGKP